MAQPYDYTLKIPAPGEAFLSGMQIGQQQQQVEAQRARAEAERAEVDRKIAEAQNKTRVFQTLLGPGATIETRNQAMRDLPDEVNAIQTYWKNLDEGRKGFFLETARDVYYGLMPDANGTVNVQTAVDKLNKRADAAKGSGDTVLEGQLRAMANLLQDPNADPRAAQGIIDLQVRAVDPDAADKMTGMGDVAGLLRAGNINPYSDKAREIFQNITFSKGQIQYQGTTPDGQPYVGTLQDYLARFGGGGGQGAPAPQQPPQPVIKPRSQRPNMTDAELISWGNKAAREGTNVEYIFRQLREWGVNP